MKLNVLWGDWVRKLAITSYKGRFLAITSRVVPTQRHLVSNQIPKYLII